jgi:hypothetical protein
VATTAFSVSRESFFLTSSFFSKEMEKYLHRRHVIGVYRFYENWSTESFMVATFASN